VLERIASMTRCAGAAAPAAPGEREESDEQLHAVENEQAQENCMHVATISRRYARRVARTPAIEAAERAEVPFTLHEYEHDPRARSFGDEAVEKLGWDAERVFKTLVVSVDGALQVACVPVSAQLDLKALGKRAALADEAAAHRATGYVLGGTSPLGQRRRLPTHVDASALDHETILVNGGRRGLQLELAPADLVRLTDARVHPLASRR